MRPSGAPAAPAGGTTHLECTGTGQVVESEQLIGHVEFVRALDVRHLLAAGTLGGKFGAVSAGSATLLFAVLLLLFVVGLLAVANRGGSD